MLRINNGPELVGDVFIQWMRDNGIPVDYIAPGKPNQNAYIERFNRTNHAEVLILYLFHTPREVREINSRWIRQYNEDRPHDSLGGLPSVVYANRMLENPTFELSP